MATSGHRQPSGTCGLGSRGAAREIFLTSLGREILSTEMAIPWRRGMYG